MHRLPLKELLLDYRKSPFFVAGDQNTWDRFWNFVDYYENCFDRTLLAGHVTGSAWILNETGDHVLLIHHRKLNQWMQPGGHSDGDPDTCGVALKEAREETGLAKIRILRRSIFDLDIHQIPQRNSDPAHEHFDVRFAFYSPQCDAGQINVEETLGMKWIPLTEIERWTSETSILRMRDKTKILFSNEKETRV